MPRLGPASSREERAGRENSHRCLVAPPLLLPCRPSPLPALLILAPVLPALSRAPPPDTRCWAQGYPASLPHARCRDWFQWAAEVREGTPVSPGRRDGEPRPRCDPTQRSHEGRGGGGAEGGVPAMPRRWPRRRARVAPGGTAHGASSVAGGASTAHHTVGHGRCGAPCKIAGPPSPRLGVLTCRRGSGRARGALVESEAGGRMARSNSWTVLAEFRRLRSASRGAPPAPHPRAPRPHFVASFQG